ncbi:hypothetical protein ACIOEX_33065, partial [Streptomyces sp. NPDC087850]|uniref:hypothetical protein n=1 Tax=Streptomyces sp. NPDC087850 TaxID=3365809 RepID=UPI0037F8DCD1
PSLSPTLFGYLPVTERNASQRRKGDPMSGSHSGKPDTAESDGHKPNKPIPPADPKRPETPKR